MRLSYLARRLRFWQAVMGLADWDIRARAATKAEGASGDTKELVAWGEIASSRRQAVVSFVLTANYGDAYRREEDGSLVPPNKADLVATHELSHVVTKDFEDALGTAIVQLAARGFRSPARRLQEAQLAQEPLANLWESTLERFAQSLVTAYRKGVQDGRAHTAPVPPLPDSG